MLQAEATNVAKQGALGFSFEVHGKSHKFEAANSGERDSWVVAIEKQVEELAAGDLEAQDYPTRAMAWERDRLSDLLENVQ